MRDRFLSLPSVLLWVTFFWLTGGFSEGAIASIVKDSERGVTEMKSSRLLISQWQTHRSQVAQYQPSPELKLLLSGSSPPNTVTSRTPSPMFMSLPSLWWVAEQVADLEKYGPKLIQDWIAYPIQDEQAGRVDLLVNRQLWSLLDYLQRYELVSRFSAIARSYGYNTRVYDNPDRPPVAAYTCRFTTENLRLLQASSSYRASSTTAGSYIGRDEMTDLMTCDLNLDPINRPGRFNPQNGN